MTAPAPPPPTTATDRAGEIVQALAPLLAQHRHRWAARCQAHGLSIVGFQVLALLEMHGGMPMTRLADELGVALPNATGIGGRSPTSWACRTSRARMTPRTGDASS